MEVKNKVNLGSVQKTLLLPLWGRAVETQKANPKLIDKTAAEIIHKIDYDFSTISKNINIITQYAWIARCLHIDRTIKRFIEKHPDSVIVNIGCGLDTTFERIDNGKIRWHDLDLPDVIELRKKLILQKERCQMIACSFLENEWLEKLSKNDNLFFVAAGVFYYFDETQIRDFFIKIADRFNESEMMFDMASVRGMRIANKKVIDAGGFDKSSFLKWGLDNIKDIEKWDSRIKVIEHYQMFKNMKQGIDWELKTGTFLSDLLKIMAMVHIRFNDQ